MNIILKCDILQDYMSKESIDQVIFAKRKIKLIDGPYQRPLRSSLNLLIENKGIPTTLSVWEQMLPCLELRDHLPDRVFNHLLIESAVPGIVNDNNYSFTQTKGGTGVLIHPEIDKEKALDYAGRFDWYREGILLSTGFRHQTRMEDVRTLPAGILTDDKQDRGKLFERLLKTGLVFLPRDEFYKAVPGGNELIRPVYGDNFWVQDCPLNNLLLITDVGMDQLTELGEAAIISNITHELLGHTALASQLPLKIMRGNDLFELNSIFLPDYFREGSANIFSLRYLDAIRDDLGFVKLLPDIDSLPKAEEIMFADTRLHYFYHTIFTAFLLEFLIKQNRDVMVDPLVGLHIPDMMKGFNLLRKVLSNNAYLLKGDETDLPDAVLKAGYDETIKLVRENVLQLKKSPQADFEDAINAYDSVRSQYLELLRRKILGGPKVTNDVEKKIQTELAFGKTQLPEELVEEIENVYKKLSGMNNKKAKEIQLHIQNCLNLSQCLDRLSFYKLLSEAYILIFLEENATPSARALSEAMRLNAHWNVQSQLIGTGAHLYPTDITHEDIEESLFPYLQADKPRVGQVAISGDDDGFMARVLNTYYAVFNSMQSRISLRGRRGLAFSEPILRKLTSAYPYDIEYFFSYLEMLSSVTKIPIPELKQTLAETDYIFIPIEEYYKQFPMLKKLDYKAFLVREHPLNGAILYTDKGAKIFKSDSFLFQNLSHELEHILMNKSLSIKVRTGDKLVEVPASLALPVWFWEGLANTLSYRFITTRGFWEFLNAQTPDWKDNIPKAAEILNANLDMPIVYFHLFTSVLFQTIFAAKTGLSLSELPDFDFNNNIPGFFEFLKSSQEIEPIIPDRNKKIGEKWIINIFNQLQKKYTLLPGFTEFSELFDKKSKTLIDQWEKAVKFNSKNDKLEDINPQDSFAKQDVKDILGTIKLFTNWVSLPQLVAFSSERYSPESTRWGSRQLYIYRDGADQSMVLAQRYAYDSLGVVRILFPDLTTTINPKLIEKIWKKFAPDLIVAQFVKNPGNEIREEPSMSATYQEVMYPIDWMLRSMEPGFDLASSGFTHKQKERIKEFRKTKEFAEKIGRGQGRGTLQYIPYWQLMKGMFEKYGGEGVKEVLDRIITFYEMWENRTGLDPGNDLYFLELFGNYPFKNGEKPDIDGGIIVDLLTGAFVGLNFFSHHPANPNVKVSTISKVLHNTPYSHLGVFNYFNQARQISIIDQGTTHVLHGGLQGSRPGHEMFKSGFEGIIVTQTSVVIHADESVLERLGFGKDNLNRRLQLINGIWQRNFSSIK